MHDDFGDEAGGRLVDWMMKVGQEAGIEAASAAADKLAAAFRNARGAAEGGKEDLAERKDWAKLDMREFQAIEGWPELRELIDGKLEDAGIRHEFFEEPQSGKTVLIYRIEDAPRLAQAFRELEEATEAAKAHAIEAIGQEKAQVQAKGPGHGSKEAQAAAKGRDPRDSEALESKAAAARKASAEVERNGHGIGERRRGREQARSR